jgi:hypothetical protein
MYELFFALFLAFACPAHRNNSHHQHHGGTTVTTMDTTNDPGTGGDDTEGEGSHIPPGVTPPTNP